MPGVANPFEFTELPGGTNMVPWPANPSILNAFSISPDGHFMSGTMAYNAPTGPSFWWTAHRQSYSTWEYWDFGYGNVGGNDGSGRGINSVGDLVGFYVPPGARFRAPFAILNGIPGFLDLSLTVSAATRNNAASDINDNRVAVGSWNNDGFIMPLAVPNPQSNATLVPCARNPAHQLALRGINNRGDVVGIVTDAITDPKKPKTDGVIILTPTLPIPPVQIRLSDSPYFANATDIKLAGINNAREIVGSANHEGFTARVLDNGMIVGIERVVFPAAPGQTGDTDLYGIDDSRLIVGTFNSLRPFLCRRRVPTSTEHILPTRVSASVAAGGSGVVTPYGGIPQTVRPPRPFPDALTHYDQAVVNELRLLASRLKDDQLAARIDAALLDFSNERT